MLWLLSIVGSYLVGSIPFGVLLGRLKGVNIRKHGSRNVGATNVTRVLGKRLGLLCFALDLAKGVGPVVVVGAIGGMLGRPAASAVAGVSVLTGPEIWLWLAVAAATVLGHMYSPFLAFGGGKGVATGFGAMVAMWPVLSLPALGGLVVWYGVLRLTKYVSLASRVAAASVPVGYLMTVIPHDALRTAPADWLERVAGAWPPLAVTGAMAVVVIYRHRANIARIRRGDEPRVGGMQRRGKMLSKE